MDPNTEMRIHYGPTAVNDASYPPNPPPYTAVAGPPPTAYMPSTVPGAIVGPATVVCIPPVGRNPSVVICPSCRMEVITRVEHKSSTKTHLMALLICIFFWPCACLPYCLDSCQNAEHFCPNCNSYIGSFSY